VGEPPRTLTPLRELPLEKSSVKKVSATDTRGAVARSAKAIKPVRFFFIFMVRLPGGSVTNDTTETGGNVLNTVWAGSLRRLAQYYQG